eukprot:3544024-Pleurochrysis_carterae.AAC.7
MWNIPRDPIGCFRSTAMFYVVPVATIVKTMIYMGLRAILGCSTRCSGLCNSKPDWMHPIDSYASRSAGCHDCENHDLYGAPRHIRMWY